MCVALNPRLCALSQFSQHFKLKICPFFPTVKMSANTDGLQLAVSVLLQVIILFTFLSVFFFIFVSKMEKKAFQNEMGDTITKGLGDILNESNLAGEIIEPYVPLLETLLETFQGLDEASVQRNIRVKDSAIFGIAILLSILITLVFTSWIEDEHIHFRALTIENLIIFGLVGIVEYVFFTHIAIKYIPVTPAVMRNEVINTLREELGLEPEPEP